MFISVIVSAGSSRYLRWFLAVSLINIMTKTISISKQVYELRTFKNFVITIRSLLQKIACVLLTDKQNLMKNKIFLFKLLL